MSLFGRLLEGRVITTMDWWGRGEDASVINGGGERNALRLVPVFGSVRLLADGVASLPMHEYRQGADGARVPIRSSPLIEHPTGFGTCYDWKFQLVASLALRGNAYGLPTAYDSLGRVSRLEWLHPDRVALDGEDDVLYWMGRRPLWRVDGRGGIELVHVRNFILPGRILGLSPIGAFQVVTETGLHAQQFGRDWFRNGSVPAAVLETEQRIEQGDAKILKERFKQAAANRDVVTLGKGAKYRAISVAANESQFLETIKATATTVATIYGIPPEEIGGETGGALTYSTDETRAARLARFSLRPYSGRIEDALSALLPRGRVVCFNLDAMLRANTTERYQAHSLALRDGWKNRDEVRATENLQPLPGGEGQTYQPVSGPKPPPREGPTNP